MAALAKMDFKETDEVGVANEILDRLNRLNLHSENQSKIPKNRSIMNFEETDGDDEIEVVNEILHRLNLNSENGTKLLPPSSWGPIKKKRSIIGNFPRLISFHSGSIKKKKRSRSVIRQSSSPIASIPLPKLEKSSSKSLSTRAAPFQPVLKVEKIVAVLLPFDSKYFQRLDRLRMRGVNPLIN